MYKCISFSVVLLLSCASFSTKAQVSINVNISNQPVWGPVGYDYVEYYYMPDLEAYYSVPRRRYVYYGDGRWITARSLPARFGTYNRYSAYKVVINEPSPWLHHDRHRTQYIKYKGRHDQVVIRDSHDERYFANPRHPEHGKWKGSPGNSGHNKQGYSNKGPGKSGNGNGGGRGHGNGGGKGHSGGHKGK